MGTAGTTFTITSTGFPTPSLSETLNLSTEGLTFTDEGNGTGLLSGTPSASTGGTYALALTAANGVGANFTQNFTLTIDQATALAGTTTATSPAAEGTAYSFQYTATGFPNPTFTVLSGSLPSGLTLSATSGLISGTPTTEGTFSGVVDAANGIGGVVTASFDIVVDQLPVFTDGPPPSGRATVPYTSFQYTATGTPAPSFSLNGTTLPAGLTLSSSGLISGTPATPGDYTESILATNAVGSATQNFTFVINNAIVSAPLFTSTPNLPGTPGSAVPDVTAGLSYSFQYTASGSPSASFTVVGGTLPAGLSLTAATGVLSGTPTAGGIFSWSVDAGNGIAPDATQTDTIVVDQAPSITSAASTTFTAGVTNTFTVAVLTPSNGYPTPSFTEVGGLPLGVSFTDDGNGDATLSGTPSTSGIGTGGTYSLTFTAANGVGTAYTQSFLLTVDEAPGITSLGSTTFTAGTTNTFTVTTQSKDYPTVSFAVSGATLPAGLSFNDTTGALSGTPSTSPPGTGGTYNLVFTAANGISPVATQSFLLTVDEAPHFTDTPSTTFTAGVNNTYTLMTQGQDFPTASFTITAAALPSGINLTDNGNGSAVLSGTPSVQGAGTGGTYSLTFVAGNGISPAATQHFLLTVDEAPGITSANNVTFTAGSTNTFTVTTRTDDFPTPSFAASGNTLPTGLTLTDNGNGTATLSGTPSNTSPGTGGVYSLVFTAANGIGAAATQTFTLTVDEAPGFTDGPPPSLTTAGNSYSFQYTTREFDYPTPTFALASGAFPGGLSLDPATGILSGTVALSSGATFTGVVTASNGINPTASQAFTIVVDEAPYFTSAASATFSEGASGTFQVMTTAFPTATNYSITGGGLPAGLTLNPSTGLISGTTSVATGSYSLILDAFNGVNNPTTQSFTVIVNPPAPQPPLFTSPGTLPTPTTVGDAYSFEYTTSGSPNPSFTLISGRCPTACR